MNNIYTCIRRAAFGTWLDCLLQLFYYFYLTLNDQSINRVNVAWNNSFRHIFSGFWWESVKPLQYYTTTLPISYFIDQRKLLLWKKNWPYITITFWYLFHGSCTTGFMPLAACMVLQQCRLQLVKLSRPFGLSLLRLFESFKIIV